jgi:hypothetical protein
MATGMTLLVVQLALQSASHFIGERKTRPSRRVAA